MISYCHRYSTNNPLLSTCRVDIFDLITKRYLPTRPIDQISKVNNLNKLKIQKIIFKKLFSENFFNQK